MFNCSRFCFVAHKVDRILIRLSVLLLEIQLSRVGVVITLAYLTPPYFCSYPIPGHVSPTTGAWGQNTASPFLQPTLFFPKKNV
jgi:hypothetical protein